VPDTAKLTATFNGAVVPLLTISEAVLSELVKLRLDGENERPEGETEGVKMTLEAGKVRAATVREMEADMERVCGAAGVMVKLSNKTNERIDKNRWI
jgi:hypothetical protein